MMAAARGVYQVAPDVHRELSKVISVTTATLPLPPTLETVGTRRRFGCAAIVVVIASVREGPCLMLVRPARRRGQSLTRHSNSDAEFAGALGARDAEGRRNCSTPSGQAHLAAAVKQEGTASAGQRVPRSSPFSKARRTAGVPSGRFLRPPVLRTRSGRLRILRRCWTRAHYCEQFARGRLR
jgi:hypothetical protein